MSGKYISILLAAFLFLQPGLQCFANTESGQSIRSEIPEVGEEAVKTEAPSVLLMEVSTGTILFEKAADEERSPASITKIMTLLLIYEELEKGTLKLEDEVVTSAHAKSMGGSQVFLEEGEKQTVETLIKCIVIASGNDAAVAMAEHISGSETEFVKKMNEKASQLGMVHTHFEDCCGLTEASDHLTSAKDVALVSRELIRRFPQIFDYSSIWMENITHVTKQGTKEFGLTNTNKLIRSYDGCVGLKTGSTSVARFCVSAAARRGEVLLLAVVMGAPDSKTRNRDAAALLNYGFGVCNLYVDENVDTLKEIAIGRGVKDKIRCGYEKAFHFLDTSGQNLDQIEKKIVYHEKIKAPLKKGDPVGNARYFLNGKEIGRVNIVSLEDVEKAGFFDYLKKVGSRLLKTEEAKGEMP